MGIGSARGDDRAVAAAEMAISSPLLEASIDGAHGVLLSISGGSDLGLFEINEAAQLVAEAAHPEANIIFGAVIDDALGDEVRVTVIAAGFDGGAPLRRADPRAGTVQAPAAPAAAPARPQPRPVRSRPPHRPSVRAGAAAADEAAGRRARRAAPGARTSPHPAPPRTVLRRATTTSTSPTSSSRPRHPSVRGRPVDRRPAVGRRRLAADRLRSRRVARRSDVRSALGAALGWGVRLA